MSVLKTMHKQPTYNELIRDISNPNKIKLPNRDATIIRRSNMLTQFDDNMDNVDEEYKKIQLKKINDIRYRDSYASHVGYIPSAIKPKPYKDIAPDEPDEEIQARMDRQALRDQQMIDSVPVPGEPQIFGISSAASAAATAPTRAAASVISSLPDIEEGGVEDLVEGDGTISRELVNTVDKFDFTAFEEFREMKKTGGLSTQMKINIIIQAIREEKLTYAERLKFMRYLRNPGLRDDPEYKRTINALAFKLRFVIDPDYGTAQLDPEDD